MRRRTAGKVAKPRICAYCNAPMMAQRPVFLVATTAGSIVGPYHAGCAERIALANKNAIVTKEIPGTNYGQLPLLPREGTLPW